MSEQHDPALVAFVREAIAMYHTTRLAGADAAEHILSKPSVKKLAASLTRSQPSAEPVAYLYERPDGLAYALRHRIPADKLVADTTVAPLYPASALEAARREALEEADFIKSCIKIEANRWPENKDVQKAIASLQRRIASFKDTPNAG